MSDIEELKAVLLSEMQDFLDGCRSDGHEVGYTEREIKECEEILDTYLAAVNAAKAPGHEAVMLAVKTVVLALNELNDRGDGSLIETGQRELLAEIIATSAAAAGVGSPDEDITEEWREW